MSILNISEDVYNEIKMHILFFISEERLYSSTLYEMIKISPGKWFDIEELAERKSVKRLCCDILVIREIVKTIDELEYNCLTGQIRIKNLNIIDDIVNERTVIFYSSNIEFDEENLLDIITKNSLTKLIVRFVKGGQVRWRRDLKPIYPILHRKVNEKSDVVILKMATRIEAVKIKKIINNLFPETNSLLAITNFFSNGCLSINSSLKTEETLVVNNESNSVQLSFISTNQSIRNGSLIVSNYIFRCNEYAIILDYLIENNLKPDIFRNFVECRAAQSDMKKVRHYVSIPPSYLGCFSILTYNSLCQSNKACTLIKSIFSYLDVKVYRDTERDLNIHKLNARSLNNVKSSRLSDNSVYCKSTCSSISENRVSLTSGSYESLENVENISDKDKFSDDIKTDQIQNTITSGESRENVENISDKDKFSDDIKTDQIPNNIILAESRENVENISDKDKFSDDIKTDQIPNNIIFAESRENVENISDKDKFSDDIKTDQIPNNITLAESRENVENISNKDKFSDDIKTDQIPNNITLAESLENVENKIESDVIINENVHISSEIQSSGELYINSLVSDECPTSTVFSTTTENPYIPSNGHFNGKFQNYFNRGFSANNYYYDYSNTMPNSNYYDYSNIMPISNRNFKSTRNRRRRR